MKLSTARERISHILVGLLAAGLSLAGCGSNTSGTSSTPATPAATPQSAAFPVTIDTARGKVTVNEKPEKIVVLQDNYLGLLSILGEKPSAWAYFLSTEDEVLESSPWLKGTFESAPNRKLFTGDYKVNIEAVAALKPDLILTTIWAADEKVYAQLSKVAPTYVGIDPVSQTSWQDHLKALAALTGHDAAVVKETEAKLGNAYAAAGTRLRGLQGKTFFVAATGDDGSLWLNDYGNDPILGMGMKPGPGQPVTGDEGADPPRFSQENIDQLTADVVFIVTEHRDPSGKAQKALQKDPRVASLPASKNGTLIFLTATQWNAVNGGIPASYLWWLDQIVPVLERSALNQGHE